MKTSHSQLRNENILVTEKSAYLHCRKRCVKEPGIIPVCCDLARRLFAHFEGFRSTFFYNVLIHAFFLPVLISHLFHKYQPNFNISCTHISMN